jgi:CxxC motif-containing protein (DUF1111 family)
VGGAPAVIAGLALVGALSAPTDLLYGSGDPAARLDGPAARGRELFAHEFSPREGLGPLFNRRSCLACHAVPAAGGMGEDGLATALRIGRLDDAGFDPLDGRGGPLARASSVASLGSPCQLMPGIPPGANLTSVRNAPALWGNGLIDAIPDQAILAAAVPRGDGVHGRPNMVADEEGRRRVGRFGWKADAATLRQFVGEAFRNELGITNPLAPTDVLQADHPPGERCQGQSDRPEADQSTVDAVTAYIAALPPPAAAEEPPPRGLVLFQSVGCASCHLPELPSRDGPARLYSDLLLHDLGPDLDDKVVQGEAGGRDWRTSPLWGLGSRSRLLHDGRASTIEAAVAAHGGEAAPATRRFRELSPADRRDLLAFLRSL